MDTPRAEDQTPQNLVAATELQPQQAAAPAEEQKAGGKKDETAKYGHLLSERQAEALLKLLCDHEGVYGCKFRVHYSNILQGDSPAMVFASTSENTGLNASGLLSGFIQRFIERDKNSVRSWSDNSITFGHPQRLANAIYTSLLQIEGATPEAIDDYLATRQLPPVDKNPQAGHSL